MLFENPANYFVRARRRVIRMNPVQNTYRGTPYQIGYSSRRNKFWYSTRDLQSEAVYARREDAEAAVREEITTDLAHGITTLDLDMNTARSSW